MTVETSAQSLLVEEVSNKTNAASQDEKTVENTHAEVIGGLFLGESTAVTDKIDESDSDGTVDVEDQVVLLGGGDGLNGKRIVQKLGRREVGLAVLLDESDTQIGVVARLDTVANTGD